MSLRAYVLAARLEEVAIAATARLRRMSDDRFSFVHNDDAERRGKRGGLGLDVLDDYSGAVRSAKTLSGGETFLASLALALGLADVVAAETGGALLDTLFVDEGFGMLDADTLDEVMDTLDELRAGGRVVGLVSHVEELRQRIPTRLRVPSPGPVPGSNSYRRGHDEVGRRPVRVDQHGVALVRAVGPVTRLRQGAAERAVPIDQPLVPRGLRGSRNHTSSSRSRTEPHGGSGTSR